MAKYRYTNISPVVQIINDVVDSLRVIPQGTVILDEKVGDNLAGSFEKGECVEPAPAAKKGAAKE